MGIVLNDRIFTGADDQAANMNMQGQPKSDPVFDGWLKHHLSRLYDPVISEPIPADLLRLLEERLG